MAQEPDLGETWDRVGGVALRLAQSGGAPGDRFLEDLVILREACDAQAARLADIWLLVDLWEQGTEGSLETLERLVTLRETGHVD